MKAPKFQARHYWAIANLLKENRPETYEELAYWHKLVDSFSGMFAEDHPGFKPDRFEQAVGGLIGHRRYGVTKDA